MYRIYASIVGAKVVFSKENGFKVSVEDIIKKVSKRTKIVFVANPNNPTGTYLEKKELINLKYGENPDQKAEYKFNKKQNCIFNNVISGKTLSYNNILDVDSGMECMHEFSEPTCVIIKHNTPCGVASSQNIKLAYHRALSCDPISSFGGVYICLLYTSDAADE